MSSDWVVWQLADSAFPTGSFAHSAGLEAAWQSGEIAGVDALWRFLRDSVAQAGHAGLPLVNAAHAAPHRVAELDELCDAFLTNAVANRASRVQGRALVATCARIWPSRSWPALAEHVAAAPGHHAPLFGACTRHLHVPLPAAQRLFLFTAARTVLAAAVRLGIAGSYHAQRLQSDCGAVFEDVLARCGGLDERSLAQVAPLLDLLQSTHDRLYSRLFQS